MEQKLNIAKILKNKPRGTKLYSMIHGKCSFEAVTDEIFKINFCTSKFGLTQSGECTLIKFGNMYDGGECIIFPSKEMRDWSKFSWKKGDVLISSDGSIEVIFDKWYDDTYTSFYCKHYLNSEDENNIKYNEAFLCTTERYFLEDKDAAQSYIKTIEKRLGGKLNLETLEIEKQTEFKDGDIVVAEEDNYYDRVIFIAAIKDDIVSKALINVSYEDYEVNYNEYRFGRNRNLRLATDSEKQQLFDALAKKGKTWDSDNKAIIDLKQKWTLKPFDKVVVRCGEADKWSIDFFSYKVSNGYICTGDAWFGYCLPYNEETAKLVGTTNNVEG
jgi:hypothetical protein